MPFGVDTIPEPPGGDDPGSDDTTVSLEVLLETVLWKYGATPQPKWQNDMHHYISFIIFPLSMPITRLSFGQAAFGNTTSEHTVYSMLFLILGYMTYFSAGMTWIMALDFKRRADTISAFGTMIDTGIGLEGFPLPSSSLPPNHAIHHPAQTAVLYDPPASQAPLSSSACLLNRP